MLWLKRFSLSGDGYSTDGLHRGSFTRVSPGAPGFTVPGRSGAEGPRPFQHRAPAMSAQHRALPAVSPKTSKPVRAGARTRRGPAQVAPPRERPQQPLRTPLSWRKGCRDCTRQRDRRTGSAPLAGMRRPPPGFFPRSYTQCRDCSRPLRSPV